MATFEERMPAMGQVFCEQLAVRRWNNGVVPAGKNKHRGLDAWQKRPEARKVASIGLDEFRSFGKPVAGRAEPVIPKNGLWRRDSGGLPDKLRSDVASLHLIECSRWCFDQVF